MAFKMKRILTAVIAAGALLCAVPVMADTGEYFFKNNISNDTRLIEMKMLGAHDAFTASLNMNSPADEAGKKLNGFSGSEFWMANDGLWESGLLASKAQSAGVEELLNSGVRYFDIRLSRYISGGEFYTTHGRISDQFTGENGVARKIAAWAADHPGEIIVLDFQSLYDIQTDKGSASNQSWRDLINRLDQDGITRYVYTKDGSIINYTYGSLTNNGTRPAIVLIGQYTGAKTDSRFINRRDEDGYVRSKWTDTTSFDSWYKAMIDEIAEIRGNTEKYYYKFRVMQAQTTTTSKSLLDAADENNIAVLSDKNYGEWMEILPVLMVDNATTSAGNFNALAVERLAKANRAGAGGKYRAVSNGVTLYGSNDNVPLGTRFSAVWNQEQLSLSLGGPDISGEMTVSLAPAGCRRRVYDESGRLLAETDFDGSLEFEVMSLGNYTVEETEEPAPFGVTKPMLWYSFTDSTGLKDLSGNGFDGAVLGSPEIGEGRAKLSPGNVIKLPAGLTRSMKNYTVSSWVYVNSPVNGSRLFDVGRGAYGSVFARLSSGDTSAGYKNTTTKQAVSGAVASGRWVHVANTYDSSSKVLSLYVDGRLVKTQSVLENPSPDSINDYLNPNGSFIGRTQWYYIEQNRGSNPDINADVADFRIYSSVLSGEEIARLARSAQVCFVDENGKELMPAVSASAAEAYNGCDGYIGEIDGYCLTGIKTVKDIAADNRVTAIYAPKGKVSVNLNSGKAEISVPAGEPEGLSLIGAVYSIDDGSLERVKIVPASELKLELECGEGFRAAGYLWNMENLEPIM